MTRQNSYSDLERLEMVAQRIVEAQADITASYGDWVDVTMACASLGEGAREAYHRICSVYPKYSHEECDAKFDNCLRTGRNMVTLGTVMKLAKDAGVDISMPRGRRQKTEQQQEEEQKNRMVRLAELLKEQAEWRHNTWLNRTELKEQDGRWRSFQERDLATYYCRVQEQGLKVKQEDINAMTKNRDFCPDYDAFKDWLLNLKPWNPDTDPDYLYDFYIGRLTFQDPENEDFYDRMLRKWHIGMVALVLGLINENPIMPIFKGTQHIGKTYFVRHILPPELSSYRLEVGPSERINKDFIISLSETPLILFDEISFGSNQKNEAFKYIVTSSRSNVRAAYDHFRETRERRASLVATTNEDKFIRSTDGTRRFLVIDLKETVNLGAFPLPYEGAYAQALYELDHGYDPKPDQDESQLISQHNSHYTEPNDCEEVLSTLLKNPKTIENATALAAGDILTLMSMSGHRGRNFTTSEIGRAMKRMGFECSIIHGRTKYLVEKIDPDIRRRENEDDKNEFVPKWT